MKKLLILSGKGGTGKTTVAASMIRLGKAQAFADCDVDAPNLHLLSHFPKDAQRKEQDFIGDEKAEIIEEKCISCGKCMEYCNFGAIHRENGKIKISEYACEGCFVCAYICNQNAVRMKKDIAGKTVLHENLETGKRFSSAELKMGRGNSGKLVTEVKERLFESIPKEQEIPFAVFDGSPGVGCPVMASLATMDLALLVTEPTVSGMSDLQRIAKTVKMCFVPLAVCINKYDVNREQSAEIEQWCREQEIPFVGKIPYDTAASKAVNMGKSVVDTEGPLKEALVEIYLQVSDILWNQKSSSSDSNEFDIENENDF